MKILLPPSETKRPGGSGGPFDPDALSLPVLNPLRRAVIDALVELAQDETRSRHVLKLSERQNGDIEHNRMLRKGPTMPAVDRYTGVLYDALDAPSLPPAARRWLRDHVWIHSAPFGPIGALDPIPAYRLAAGTALPGIPSLRRHWAESTSAAIAQQAPTLVLDLRSEAYVALGPLPATVSSAYVRVVTDDEGGPRALNHFNKHAKGALVRVLAQERPRVATRTGLLAWARGRGVPLRATSDDRILELVAD